MCESVATLSHTYAVFMLVWLLIDYVQSKPSVILCKAGPGEIGRWRIERARRRLVDPRDFLPWHFYNPPMTNIDVLSYFSKDAALPYFTAGSSRIYIHTAPFPAHAFAGTSRFKRVSVKLPIRGPLKPFHYTVCMDRQEPQSPHDLLLNHNIAPWGDHHLYGNILAIKNVIPSLPNRKGIFWPYEESAHAVSATMEDTGIIKDVLELLPCTGDSLTMRDARSTRAIWVEVTTLDDNLPLSPIRSPQPFISHLSDEVPIPNISSRGKQVPVNVPLRAEPRSEVSSQDGRGSSHGDTSSREGGSLRRRNRFVRFQAPAEDSRLGRTHDTTYFRRQLDPIAEVDPSSSVAGASRSAPHSQTSSALIFDISSGEETEYN